ncbi:MAG: GNAT family N-acetyltransferase [Anaerolineales bacterium]
MNDTITIKQLETIEEAEACEDLQVAIWPSHPGSAGFSIPIHMLAAQIELGGAVLGAYEGGQMVGFLYTSLERDEQDRLYHYSWLAGVLPEYRHRKVMEKLKYRNAEIARAQGAYKIVWTYDPLQGANANLNVRKLGGVVRRYYVNHYGARAGGSPQNIGMPSDHFLLEWFVDGSIRKPDLGSYPVADLLDLGICRLVNRVKVDKQGLQIVSAYDLDLDHPRLLVEIPGDFEGMRAHPERGSLDVEWRLITRKIFLRYVRERGYRVVDFVSERKEGRRNFYVLEKK